jgi:poly(A) polymerase Pap1
MVFIFDILINIIVPVDLSFTRLDMQIIEKDLKLGDNKLLANMDIQSVLSLNGRR